MGGWVYGDPCMIFFYFYECLKFFTITYKQLNKQKGAVLCAESKSCVLKRGRWDVNLLLRQHSTTSKCLLSDGDTQHSFAFYNLPKWEFHVYFIRRGHKKSYIKNKTKTLLSFPILLRKTFLAFP